MIYSTYMYKKLPNNPYIIYNIKYETMENVFRVSKNLWIYSGTNKFGILNTRDSEIMTLTKSSELNVVQNYDMTEKSLVNQDITLKK